MPRIARLGSRSINHAVCESIREHFALHSICDKSLWYIGKLATVYLGNYNDFPQISTLIPAAQMLVSTSLADTVVCQVNGALFKITQGTASGSSMRARGQDFKVA